METKDKAIAIEFEGGVYIQRLEPDTASQDLLTTQERLIIHLYEQLQKTYDEKEVDVLIKAFHLDFLQGRATKETAQFCVDWVKENLYK